VYGSWLRKQSGQAVVLVAIAVVVLAAILMLALDGGGVYLDQRQIQNAADAAALAGAEKLTALPPNYATIHNIGITTLVNNLPRTSLSGTPCGPSGTAACPNQATLGPPGATGVGTVTLGAGYFAELSVLTAYSYQVSVWHTHPVAFAPIHGFQSTITLGARATAENASFPYAIVLLQDQIAQYSNLQINGTPGGLSLSNVSGVTGGKGGVFSNESINPGSGSITFSPNCSSVLPTPGVGDLWSVNESSADAGRVATGTTGCGTPPPATYPLQASHLPYPSYPEPPAPNINISNGATVLNGQISYLCPGIYGNQVNVQTGATAVLLPGVFWIQVGGVSVNGTLRTMNASDFPPPAGYSIVGGCSLPNSLPSDTGVIVEITPANASGSTVCNKHQFTSVGGSSSITLTPSPKYYNISVYIETMPNWQTTCTQTPLGTNVVSLTGGGYYNIGGAIYGPADNMKINGGAAGSGVGQIIAWTLTLGGNGAMSEIYNPAYLPYLRGLTQ
jgi:hypothetical protein